jgi:hypothetical protein
MQPSARLGQTFKVPREAAQATHLGRGTFHEWATGQQHAAMFRIGQLNHFKLDAR